MMDNHAICLLAHVARGGDGTHSYYALSKATGIPQGTLWHLLNWQHEFSPHRRHPLYYWADCLGYTVRIPGFKGRLIEVIPKSI